MSRNILFVVLLVLSAVPLALPPNANGQQFTTSTSYVTLTQTSVSHSTVSLSTSTGSAEALLGFTWPRQDIPVVIPTLYGPEYAGQVLAAMRIWNISQSWFIKTYMGGNGATFNLFNASHLGPIGGIVVNYTGTPINGTAWGTAAPEWNETSYTNQFGKTTAPLFTSVTCKVLIYSHAASLVDVALHEFGHCLGLGHTALGGGTNDLMSAKGDTEYGLARIPSTLNLYAVYLLSKANATVANMPPDPVALPKNIPYNDYPPINTNPIPEFELGSMWLLAVALIGVAFAFGRKKKYFDRSS